MYCIGLISGTSVDGIDAALVEIHGETTLNVQLIHGQTYPYSPQLREQILAVCHGQALSIEAFAELDDAIAKAFAQAAKAIQSDYPTADLIGSHGQTVFHRPPTDHHGHLKVRRQPPHPCPRLGYSLQLGRGEVIAQLTQIPTVSNFRVADIAASGQGAPLVSKVDAYLLSHPTKHRCVQNIGGIGNVTYLPPRQQENWEANIMGWDTGPGNVLVDLAIQKLTQGQQTYDNDGQWAARGKPYQNLIHQWLEQDFFLQPPPKSTGRELFGQAYLQQCWQDAQTHQPSEADWLATLTDFTAASIVHSYQTYLKQMPDEVMVCGGGSHNSYLKERIQTRLGQSVKLLTTDDLGLSSDFKEAIAFAVLAYWRFCCGFPGNLPQVTGAKKAMLLGDIHLPI